MADYDQVELRAIAHLSGDPGLTAAFAAGEDIHRTVASQVFGVDRDDVTHAQRSTAKMVSYGLAYGMEAYGLSQRLAVPVEEAQADPPGLLRRLPVGARLHGAGGVRGPERRLHGDRLRPTPAACPT